MENQPDGEKLESWKEIAAYLRRTEKTCRRWEKVLGLPIHRLEDSARARVFAYKEEVDLWVKKAGDLDDLTDDRKVGVAGPKVRKRLLVYIAAASSGILAFLSIWLVFFERAGRPPASRPVHSVAILPFKDLSSGRNQEHLADGMTDALINALCSIPGLHVPARTSSFFFKGKNTLIQEIGRVLRSDALIEGSIQVSGKTMRVTVDLVFAADGYHLWSEQYDRPLDEIFAVQDEIAQRIVDTLKTKLPHGENPPLVAPAPENLQAYNLYLLGRHFWYKRGKNEVLKSIEYFKEALAIDHHYSLAYAGLAGAYYTLANNQFLQPREAYPLAKRFAQKTLEIDDKIAQAHFILASVKLDYEWDFAGAEREFKRAIEKGPGYANSHQGYAFLLSYLGRHEEAANQVKLARDLDPLDARIRANVGLILYHGRKYQEALEELLNALEFDPDHAATHNYLGYVYREIGRYADSIAHYRKAIDLDDHPTSRMGLAISYFLDGEKEQSKEIMSQVEEISKKQYVSPASLAEVWGVLGENDTAFELLNRACAERDRALLELKSCPAYDPLRLDSRFASLLKKTGLAK